MRPSSGDTEHVGMMSPVCLIFLVVPLVAALRFDVGRCPTPSLQANFSLQRYMGRWYDIEKLPSIIDMGKCVETTFGQRSDGSTSVIFNETVADMVQIYEGTAHQDPEEPAKMKIVFPYYLAPEIPSWVLRTDYTNMAAVYSCVECNVFSWYFHVDHAWITSRTRSLAPAAMNEAKGAFLEAGIDISSMVVSDQTCCE